MPLDDPAKQKALNEKIDAAIADVEAALQRKRDRRGPPVAHEPEKRGGFDRRTSHTPKQD